MRGDLPGYNGDLVVLGSWLRWELMGQGRVSNLIQANKEAVKEDRKSNHKTVRAHNSMKRWAEEKTKRQEPSTQNTTNTRPVETVSTTGDTCKRYGHNASWRATLVRAEFEGKTRIGDACRVLKVFFSLSKRMTGKRLVVCKKKWKGKGFSTLFPRGQLVHVILQT